MLALRPTPTVLRPDPALSSAWAAFGSAVQMSAAAGMGPSSTGMTQPFAMFGPVSADPEDPLSFGASVARATPWPYNDTEPGGQVPRTDCLGESQPSGSAAMCVPNQIRNSLNVLHASIAPSSRAHYERAWRQFAFFHDSLGVTLQLPASVSMILLFIAHLHAHGSAPASITSISSAVAYFHNINVFSDPTNCFIVAKVLAGACNLGSVSDVRLPVTLPVLTRLVLAYQQFLHHDTNVSFKAYLQVGEMVPRGRNLVQRCLHMRRIAVRGYYIAFFPPVQT